MSDEQAHQLEQEQRQQIVECAVKKAYAAGLITKDEVWAIGYEAGFPIRLEDA